MIPYALTLVGRTLSQPKIDSLTAGLRARGMRLTSSKWLSPRFALDLYVDVPEGVDTPGVVQDVRRALPQVDVSLMPVAHRRKSLLVADMDSTLITSESINEIARIAGTEEAVTNLTNRAMRGRVDFAEALVDRVRLVAETPEAEVSKLGDLAEFSPGARALCATMAAAGARLVMVSGGFTHISQVVAQRLGLHRNVANTLAVADGKLTGGLHLPIIDGQMKAQILGEECESGNLHPDQVLAVGDGANDLAMIAAAGLGVAFHGKPVVQAAADAAINHSDLTTLLYFQGFEDNEFIHP